MLTAWTSGPWHFSSQPYEQPSPLYAGIVCIVEHSEIVAAVHAASAYVAKEQWPANGHLIAAAPDLYEALELAQQWMMAPGSAGAWDDETNRAKFAHAQSVVEAALAKARGENPK